MNNKIIIAAVFIGGTGVLNSVLNGKPITPVIIGSFILLFVLAIADMFGGQLSQLSGGIAMVAVVYVLLHEFPWKKLSDILSGTKAA
jgi:hypothetical protein